MLESYHDLNMWLIAFGKWLMNITSCYNHS